MGENMVNGALFYPNIHLKNPEVVKESLLFYDNLYRIVPDEVSPEDDKEIEIFNYEYGLIKEISPKEYVEETYNQFKKNLKSWSKTASGISFDSGSRVHQNLKSWSKTASGNSRMHKDKVYEDLRRKIVDEIIVDYDGTWFSGNDSFIGNYMVYLALEVSKRNNLCLVTDYDSAWTSQEFMNYNGNYSTDSCPFDEPSRLLGMYIYDYVPSNISKTTFDDIVEFRERYRTERKNFINKYSEFQTELSSITSKEVFSAKIEDQVKSLRQGINDYKESCSYFKAEGFFGLSVVTIPALLDVADTLVSIDPKMKSSLMISGLAFGILWGLTSAKQNIKELQKTNPYSYLVILDKYNFEKVTNFNSDLFDDNHQFIED